MSLEMPDSADLAKRFGPFKVKRDQGKFVEARHERNDPFEPEEFAEIAAAYSGGGAWHALPDPQEGDAINKAYPGIKQQWMLDGYGGILGWAGTGWHASHFFAVFATEIPGDKKGVPAQNAASKEPWARPDILTCMDTLSGWFTESCQRNKEGKKKQEKNFCFRSSQQTGLFMEIIQTPQSLTWIWTSHDAEPLQELREGFTAVSAQKSRSEELSFAQDASSILWSEARFALARWTQDNPCLFLTPSWVWTQSTKGKVEAESLWVALEPLKKNAGPMRLEVPAYRYAWRPPKGKPVDGRTEAQSKAWNLKLSRDLDKQWKLIVNFPQERSRP